MMLSVLMSVFNEERYIQEAIDSILSQEVDFEIEICIVDDLSTDNTYEFVKNFYKNERRIKLFKNTQKGKVFAFNYAYERAKGDYYILFAGDDILVQGSLKKRIQPLIGGTLSIVSLCKLKTFSKKVEFDGVVSPKNPDKGAFTGGCMAINKTFAKKIFPIPTVLANEDSWIICCFEYFTDIKIIHVPIIGINYRIHENNSVPRDGSFDNKNIFLHRRFIAYSVFLEKYRTDLNEKNINSLEALVAAENLRYQNNTVSILLMSNVPFKKRARMVLYSNRFLFWIYNRFFTFL